MTNYTHTRRMVLACLPVLAALFGLLVLPPLSSDIVPTPAAAQKQPPQKETRPLQCGDLKVPSHYYTYEPAERKESPHAFGPAASTANAAVELKMRLCGFIVPDGTIVGGDWALLQALQGMVDGTDPNRTLTQSKWQAQVRDFTDRIMWDMAFVVHRDARHEPLFTLYMTGKLGTQPTVHAYWKDSQKKSAYLFAPVRQKDGRVVNLMLRLDCGFQPEYTEAHEAPKALR